MLARLRQLWMVLRRRPLVLILVGVIIGIPIGSLLVHKSAVEKKPVGPAKPTAYTALSNEQLKGRSAHLVSAIRDLTKSFYEEDNRMRIAADEKSGHAMSKSEREGIRKRWIEESAKLHDMFMDRYKNKFWADALLLREAMVARLGASVPGARNSMLFQQPTNVLGVEQVANSLELLGKSLPQK